MKKIFIFASSERSYQELKNVYNYLYGKECKVIFLYSLSKITFAPSEKNISKFILESNFELDEKDFTYHFPSISTYLPFIPDSIVISRESWLPETNLIVDFKQKGSLIYCVENSSWLYNNIKSRLEILSRFRFPTNVIDIFFDHSSWTFQSKKEAGWVRHKSIITGIPKFDSIITNQNDKTDMEYIIVYGSMESNIRKNILSVMQNILSSDISKKYKVCYKPHPTELIDYKTDFDDTNSGPFKDVILIENENDLIDYVKKSYCNVGIFSSVMFYPILMKKNILHIDSENSGVMSYFNFDNFEGKEFDFWKPIINVKTFEEFVEKVGKDRVSNFEVRYKTMIDAFNQNTRVYNEQNINMLDNSPVDYSEITMYFDEYADGKASERVGDFILRTYI
jgi:hypothetical protein